MAAGAAPPGVAVGSGLAVVAVDVGTVVVTTEADAEPSEEPEGTVAGGATVVAGASELGVVAGAVVVAEPASSAAPPAVTLMDSIRPLATTSESRSPAWHCTS